MSTPGVNIKNQNLLNHIAQWTHAFIAQQFQSNTPLVDFMLICGSILHPEYRRPDSDIDIIVSLSTSDPVNVTRRRSHMEFGSIRIPVDLTYDRFEGISKAIEHVPLFLSQMILEGFFAPGGDPIKVKQVHTSAQIRLEKEKRKLETWMRNSDLMNAISYFRHTMSDSRSSILWELDLSRSYSCFKLLSTISEYIEQVALFRGKMDKSGSNTPLDSLEALIEQALLIKIYSGPRLFKHHISKQVNWLHSLVSEINPLLSNKLDAQAVENIFSLLSIHFQQEFGNPLFDF